MKIRQATREDVSAGGEIYREAKRYMRESGNPTQWREGGYPSEYDIEKDIEDGTSYVCEDGGEVVGVFHFHVGTERDYEKIYEGSWEGSSPYGVIHRIAVKHRGRGIADFCFSECAKIAGSVRIDTHRDNLPMQKSLARAGFAYRGIVYIKNGEERLAYERIDKE